MGPRAGLGGRKISPPPGFDPRTVQPVVSRYTDYATRPILLELNTLRTGSFKLFKRPFPGFLTILTL